MKNFKQTSLSARLDTRLAAYAAAGIAVAAPALAPSAKADIVYSGVLTLAVPQNGTGIYLDLATNATSTTGSFVGYDINFYGTAALTFFRGTGTTLESLAGAAAAPSALPFGTNISSTSTFSTSAAATNFQVLGTEYLGIRFTNTTTAAVNYGWIQLATGAPTTGYPATILGYAYENTGGAIAAGQITAVPEPTTNAALGLGALALGAVAVRRMRRNKPAVALGSAGAAKKSEQTFQDQGTAEKSS